MTDPDSEHPSGNPAAPATAQEMADLAAQILPLDEQGALPATVVKGLDTAEQQRSAAEGVIGVLPAGAKQDLASTVVKSMETPEQQRAAAQSALGALPVPQQTQVVESALGSPDGRTTRQRLWYIVVGTMAVAVFFFGSMAFVLIYQGKAAEAPLALATTALGALVGLVATSPGASRG